MMTDRPKKFSDTARALLGVAALRDDHLVPLPRLPVAAARQVIRSMLNAELVEEVPAPIKDATFAWRTGEDGRALALRATALGVARTLEGDGGSRAPAMIGSVPGGLGKRTDVQPGAPSIDRGTLCR